MWCPVDRGSKSRLFCCVTSGSLLNPAESLFPYGKAGEAEQQHLASQACGEMRCPRMRSGRCRGNSEGRHGCLFSICSSAHQAGVAPVLPDKLGAKALSENSNLAYQALFPSQGLTELIRTEHANTERAQHRVSTWQALHRCLASLSPPFNQQNKPILAQF